MGERNLGAAVAWMAGALVAFSISALSIRSLAKTLGLFEILSLRSLAGIVLVGAYGLILAGGPRRLALRRPGLQFVRSLVHTGGQATWAYAITLLPLATVFALEFTSPVWLALLAVPLLGERLTLARIGAIGLGLAGVLVILRPGLSTIQPASLSALAAALSFAITGIATKRLTATESTLAILFWMNVMQLPMNLIGSDPLFPGRIEPWQAPALAGFCLSGVLSHLCLTQAYRNADATVVIPLDFLRVPLIAVVGWWVYGEVLDGFVLGGAAVVMTGIALNIFAEARRRPT